MWHCGPRSVNLASRYSNRADYRWHRPPYWSLCRRIVAARAHALAQRLEAFLARDRPAPDHLREQVIREHLDVARRQRRRWRQRRRTRAHFGFSHAVAALVAVGLLIEVRHRGS